jgi:creatinine amidohydrolase
LLAELARDFALERGVNTLVINWWSTCSAAAEEVFGNPGGHAGENETAFIQAIDPALVKRDLYEEMTVTPNAPPGAWSATPAPSSITTYEKDVGAPIDFDQAKADDYFRRVNACVAALINDTLRKWERAGFN